MAKDTKLRTIKNILISIFVESKCQLPKMSNPKIEIDKTSGFCYGVIRAVKTAEKELKSSGKGLYSLGAIVHNGSELTRLAEKGLEVIDIEKMKMLKGTKVLIRAHGEPPSTYNIAKKNGIDLIDCTCPVVLALQKKIATTNGQIIIFGKIGHAEVNGLVGRAENGAVVIENKESLDKIVKDNKIDFNLPIAIFSQNTKDPIEFKELCTIIKKRMANPNDLTIHNTICKQVATRHSQLKEFAQKHDVIIFVSGKDSSNGQVLYELCKEVNYRSFHIQSLNQIDKKWFKKGDTIGICGATSTPLWQLQSVYKFLKITLNSYICSNLKKIIYGNYSRF